MDAKIVHVLFSEARRIGVISNPILEREGAFSSLAKIRERYPNVEWCYYGPADGEDAEMGELMGREHTNPDCIVRYFTEWFIIDWSEEG